MKLDKPILRVLAMEQLDDEVYKGGNSLTRLQIAGRLKVPFTEGVLARTLINLTTRGHIKKLKRGTLTKYRITSTGDDVLGF